MLITPGAAIGQHDTESEARDKGTGGQADDDEKGYLLQVHECGSPKITDGVRMTRGSAREDSASCSAGGLTLRRF